MKKLPVRSSLSPLEASALRALSDGRRVVEAGALLGYSALVLAEQAASVVSIDKHEGYGAPTLAPYMSNLDRFGAGLGRIVPIVGDALEELPKVAADAAFIDLTGSEALTGAALAALHPAVQIAAVHDFGRQRCHGVEEAIKRSKWEIAYVVDTLAVVTLKGGD